MGRWALFGLRRALSGLGQFAGPDFAVDSVANDCFCGVVLAGWNCGILLDLVGISRDYGSDMSYSCSLTFGKSMVMLYNYSQPLNTYSI